MRRIASGGQRARRTREQRQRLHCPLHLLRECLNLEEKSISNDEKYGKERTDFVGRVDDAEVVTQPANGKACNSNGSLGDSCEVLGGS